VATFQKVLEKISTPRRYLVEAKAWNTLLSQEETFYWADGSKGFTTEPGDTPANQHYDGRLNEALSTTRAMYSPGRIGGRSMPDFGQLALNNTNGDLDILKDYSFDGREIKAKMGDGTAHTDFEVIFFGTAANAVVNEDVVTIRLRSRQQELETFDLQQEVYRGTDYAIVFDSETSGVAERVAFGSPSELNITGDLTIESWVYIDSATTDPGKICQWSTGGAANSPFIFAITASRALRFNATGITILDSTDTVSNDGWHHVAVTVSGTTLRFYIDGVEDSGGSQVVSAARLSATGVFTFSQNSFGATSATMKMDESRIWTVARTVDELLENKDGEIDPRQDNLVCYMKWNDRSGVTAVNSAKPNSVGQTVRPINDPLDFDDWTNNTWDTTPLFDKIDEVAASDADYIQTPNDDLESICSVKLSPALDPFEPSPGGGAYTVNYRRRVVGTVASHKTELLQGRTRVIASQTKTDTPAAWQAESFTLTPSEAAAITDFGDLYLRFTHEAGQGSANRFQVSWAEFQLPLYTGTNGTLENGPTWEATLEGQADLNGQVKPFLIGQRRNIEPVLVDPPTLTFQYHSRKSEKVIAVYDQGALLNPPEDPSPGYSVDLNKSTITLLAAPAGRITMDVKGDAEGGYVETVSDIVSRLLVDFGPLTAGDLNASTFTALNVTNSSLVGFYATDRLLLAEVVDLFMDSIGGFWGENRTTGKFEVGRFDAPSGTPDLEVDEYIILDIERKDTALPTWRRRVGFDHNPTVQTRDDLAGSVLADQDRIKLLGQEWRIVKAVDESVKTAFLLARDPDMIPTLLIAEADAQREVDRLQALYGVPRELYSVTVKTQAFKVGLNDVVNLIYNRFSLSGGKLMRVVGLVERSAVSEVTMDLWG